MKKDNINQLLKEVLIDIQPDKNYEYEIFRGINDIIKKINQGQKNIKAVLGGSGAKGTWLKTFDADIFVLFDYKKFKDKSDKLSDILEKILKKKFKNVIRLHGSRDYFQLKQGNFTFEIVPILKIKKAEQAKNITDVSPLHSRWVAKHKKLITEMRLSKQFCQAQNVYGAESYIRGFSGYVCEILIAYYGSFLSLVKNAVKWQDRIVVDAEKYYKGKDVFKLVNTSKLISPLIVIDPVQKDRNAAAALSYEKFNAFKKAAKYFLSRPSKDFFVKNDLKKQFLKEKTKTMKLIIVEIEPIVGKTDVVGSKLLKIYEFLSKKLKEQNFKIIKKEWEWDKKNPAYFYLLLDKKPLGDLIEIEGPPMKMKEHINNFRKLHKKTFIKSGKIYSVEKRKFSAAEDLIKGIFKEQFIKERCESRELKLL